MKIETISLAEGCYQCTICGEDITGECVKITSGKCNENIMNVCRDCGRKAHVGKDTPITFAATKNFTLVIERVYAR